MLYYSLYLNMTQMLDDILKLSVAERILLVEAIWDSIPPQEDSIEVSDETRKLLEERVEAHRQNPDSGSPWEEVKARIERQL